MADKTKIQWCDSTVNPIMGCGGCELFPTPENVLTAIAAGMNTADAGVKVTSAMVKSTFRNLVTEVFRNSENPDPGHKKGVNLTNIWHLRERFHNEILNQYDADVAKSASDAIRKSVTCYAATLHLNKGANILDREGIRPGKDKPREVKRGYAPIFESVTQFEGRSTKAAKSKDLLGLSNPGTPWKAKLSRMIFVSDMGDALSAKKHFPFLKSDLMLAILSDDGKRHLWLWLTKRPGRMAEFADQIGGFPENVCAMTTLTGPDEMNFKRLADLKKVRASIRGLSIEPLWERIPPSELNLTGIHWMIVGGESGSGGLTRPFPLEWAEELREHCRKHGVAFFLKQLGRNPSRGGEVFALKDKHGGDWDEWDESLRTREFPQAFHDYRQNEMDCSAELRPAVVKKAKKPTVQEDTTVTTQEKAEYKRHHAIVEKGVQAFWKVGQALAVIKTRRLWRAGGYASWDAYCRSVVGMSRGHAHRLLGATEFMEILKTSPRGDVLPLMEAQVRPLLRLPDPDQQVMAWETAVKRAEGRQPSAPDVRKVVFEILHPEGAVEGPVSRAKQRLDLVGRLKQLIETKSWAEAKTMLAELEGLL